MATGEQILVFVDDRPEKLCEKLRGDACGLEGLRAEVSLEFPVVLVRLAADEHLSRRRHQSCLLQGARLLARRHGGSLVSGEGMRLAEELVARLVRRELSLTVAESCTGGLVARQITAVPGASRTLRLGLVTYADVAKTDMLGVPGALLQRHGAVSRETARAMLGGALRAGRSDCALVTTGIAGPTGGSEAKPVGLVFVGAAHHGVVKVSRKLYRGRSRRQFQYLAAAAGMKMLLDLLGSGRKGR